MRILDLKIFLIMFKRLNAVHLSGTNVKRYLDLKYQDQSERVHVFQGRESKKYDKFTTSAWQAEQNISFLDVSSLHQAKFQLGDDRFNVTTVEGNRELGFTCFFTSKHVP